MNPNILISRQSIPLDKLVILDPAIKHYLAERVGQISNFLESGTVLKGESYPWGDLLDGMKEQWDPAHRDTTYHSEPAGYSPFKVHKRELNGEVVYVPENGRHRFVALKSLGIDPVDCFVVEQDGLEHVDVDELKSFLTHMDNVVAGGQQYQSLVLPNGVKHNSRDVSLDVFNSSGWSNYQWCGKTVLDIGCHIGEMCFEAKRRGAERVVGFDLDGKLTGLGAELSKILDLEVEFFNCDFWNFPLWDEQFDIVTAHQCLYHFNTVHRCENAKDHTKDEMLDLVTGACREDLFSYTFIHDDDKPSIDPEGYRPTKTEFIRDLNIRGFVQTEIKPLYPHSAKRAMVASKVVY